MPGIAAIILAAGGSSRLGRPKQLLPYGESTLLRHVVQAALGFDPVVVVLGAHADLCREAIAGLPVTVVVNERWEEGMGGSIAAGVAEIAKDPRRTPDAVLLMLCDQPHLSAEHLNRLAEAHLGGEGEIVASEYGGSAGVPALFSRRFFPELLALDPAQGAKPVIAKYAGVATRVPFPEGVVDIDTPADYERLAARRD